MTYQQIYPKSQQPLPRGPKSDAFLSGIKFTSSRPTAARGPKDLFSTHMQSGLAALSDERWSEAAVSFEAASKAAAYFGPQNVSLATALYYLASSKNALGQVAEAERLFLRALDIFDAQSDKNDLEVAKIHAVTLQDLAILCASRGASTRNESRQADFNQAERLLQRALALREKYDPTQVGRTFSNLTQVYVDSSRWTDAAAAGERAASFYEKQNGPNDQRVIYQLDRLIDIYVQLERFTEAKALLERVLSGMETNLGSNAPAIARRLESYAASLRKAGRVAEAAELEARAKAIQTK